MACDQVAWDEVSKDKSRGISMVTVMNVIEQSVLTPDFSLHPGGTVAKRKLGALRPASLRLGSV